MNLLKVKNGFILQSCEVSFDFVSELIPEKKNDLFRIEMSGEVPVPEIKSGDRILLPVDEGIALCAEKEYVPGEFSCDDIGGYFCSRNGTMSMIIVERQNKYLLIALDNGVNSRYRAWRNEGLYKLSIVCNKECGVTYGIFDSLVSACKCYRNIKKYKILTLEEKIEENPEISKLIGGSIFWIWNDNYDEVMYSDKDTDVNPCVGNALLEVAENLYNNGVRNALFGIFFNGDSHLTEPLYKKYGYITTQYDNYNDVLNPELLSIIPNNRAKNCDYTFRRMKDYPKGVQINCDGSLAKAWELKGFDGNMHSQNALCPLVANERIKTEVPEIINEFPYYKGRFIDVYGGSLSCCFSKEHPVTREQCLDIKNDAFRLLSDLGLIAGTEDGFEDIINNLVYTEGLHSPVHFRNKNSGRMHAHTYSEAQEEHIRKNMLNPECRVPLWHLVYHENLFAFPYWGDSTEMSPELTDKKVLFACLYGCPALYSFSLGDYEKLKDKILDIYKKINDVHEKIALLPMTDFQILTDDFNIQKSVFGDKYEVVVNFSDKDFLYNDKIILPCDMLFKEL